MSTMGYTLASEVGALGLAGKLGALSPNAIVCLHIMAITARDRASASEPARIYFGGWEYLARAGLGREQYDDAAERAVARAMRELLDAGLIKDVGRRHGIRQGAAMYELLFGRL